MTSKFDVGQLVQHLRYGYRGVIYDVDPHCTASDVWYQSNKTQPPRDQPWYHVLVDGSSNTTYVAESNLEADLSGKPIRHPMVGRCFVEFSGGRYHLEHQN